MLRLPAWLAAAILLGPLPAAVQAQETPAAPQSAILTIDQERLYAGSAWGRRAAVYLADISGKLAAENRELEAQLVAEEKALTEARPTMNPEAFRTAADQFDARVVELRRVQDAKSRAIVRISDAERQGFYAAALPVMGEVLQRRGAVVVLDSRAIFVSSEAIDVTADMIEAIDETVGAGENAADPAPETGSAGAEDGAETPQAAQPPAPGGAN